MDDKRKGEIALAVLKRNMRRDGLKLQHEDMHTNIEKRAQEIGIPVEEVKEFAEMMAREFVDDFFKKLKEPPKPSVTVERI